MTNVAYEKHYFFYFEHIKYKMLIEIFFGLTKNRNKFKYILTNENVCLEKFSK